MMFIPLALIAGLALYLVGVYNSLVSSRVRIREAWSQIDVQLKRRYDLIPNLIEAVKGYMKHEKEVLEGITAARTRLMQAESKTEKAKADNALSETLKSLFAVAENYPQLKASENFMHLQRELSDTEDKIAYSRQFYNTAVMDYNTKIAVVPNSLIASNFGFSPEEYFKTEGESRENVKVKFS